MSKWMLSFSDNKRVNWDIFVIILAVWNCIYITFSISFEFNEPLGIFIVNSIIDALFFVDIIVTFRTTYFDKSGEEIKEPKRIAKTYLKSGRFFIDLLSSIPFPLFYTVIFFI